MAGKGDGEKMMGLSPREGEDCGMHLGWRVGTDRQAGRITKEGLSDDLNYGR